MSFISDSKKIFGKSVSMLNPDEYRVLEHKLILVPEKREAKKEPKFKKNDFWLVSSSQLKTMNKRVALKT